ncbi:type VI secretion protein [Streptomyces sp. NPDC058157]|uniref:type VI secretion protein n=1 Tax=Streptomyces sp. NPDC058157 TaxID=3346360 RepID=UPI0036E295A8
MHDARGTEPRPRGGGIPDGALVGLLAFLLGLAVLVWSATGLAALFAKGAWPATVTFTRTPGAVRALITQPHDIPAAWPDTAPAALSGWGLFWGLFISQLLVLLVLTIFTLGVVTRTKARRAAARQHAKTPAPADTPRPEPEPTTPRVHTPAPTENHGPSQDHGPGQIPGPTPGPVPGQHSTAYPQPAPGPAPTPGSAPGRPSTAYPQPTKTPGPDSYSDSAPALHTARRDPSHAHLHTDSPPGTAPTPEGVATPHRDALAGPGTDPNAKHAPAQSLHTAPATHPAPEHPHPATTPAGVHLPHLHQAEPPAYPEARPAAQEAYRYGFGYAPAARPTTPPPAHRVAYAPPAERLHLAAQAVSAAEGAVLVVTSSPALWQDTKDARAKLGPVLLYDPSHLCDTPARIHWNPADGCADRDTAAARAIALLAAVRPQARLDAAVADTAETLVRSWLQAAALDGLPFKQLARWAQGNGSQEPVRILRTHPQAAPGAAGELESALIAHPERREQAQYLTARALSCLTSVHIREACNPNRTDALTLASFAAEGGTLYVVGEPLEDPRTRPGAMPLLTALASHVVEHGRRMAARSSHGRLDPPMTLVLEDVAAVAPVPRLPDLLTDGKLPLLALCRSREQARARWPEWPLA